MRAWLVCAGLAAGCFTKPDPPEEKVCTPWTEPVQLINLGAESVNGGWLSDDGKDVWYAQLFDGDHDILHATGTGTNVFVSAMLPDLNSAANEDDPFVDAAGTVWFTRDRTTDPQIVKWDSEDNVTSTPKSLGGFVEPSLTMDGRLLACARDDIDGPHLYLASRNSSGEFAAPVRLAYPDRARSPSLSADGTRIMFTQIGDSFAFKIYEAALVDGVVSGATMVPGLQQPEFLYFDPNLSLDGRTLVFARSVPSPPPGGIQLWKTTRVCD